jgi:predicted lipid-binding transport protein (Tim44 family)
MENFVKPHQNTIAQSLDYQTAQLALSTLQKAGFPPGQFSVIPQDLDPNSSFNETEAAKGAGVGAMTGTVFGGLMGGLIAYANSLSVGSDLGSLHLVGLVLVGSGVGALAVSILGAFTGMNVHKDQAAEAAVQYILIANITPAELEQAQILLQGNGISVTPN